MSNDKLTNIFPPEILPVRSGVYKTQACDPNTGKPINPWWGFSYFDSTDRVWGCAHDTVDSAWKDPDYEFANQYKQWCGLNEEPKA